MGIGPIVVDLAEMEIDFCVSSVLLSSRLDDNNL